MTEHEKEKYELLCQLELVKEAICIEKYKAAYWETIFLKEQIEEFIQKERYDN